MEIDLTNIAGESRGIKKDVLTPEELEVDISYLDPTGETHECVLISRIMDGGERAAHARTMASLAGCPWDRLPSEHKGRISALATITHQTIDPPKWLLKWCQMDDALLQKVVQVLDEHEAKFFRGGAATGLAEERIKITARDLSISA